KWNHVNQVLRDNRIGILAIQETHLDDARKASVEAMFRKQMEIISSPDPEKPRSQTGVAIVLNKRLIQPEGTQTKVLIPGRAILTTISTHPDSSITILAIYAPNDTQENENFWTEIREWFTNNPRAPKPDIVLGDFNLV
ncbi:hypothetical protein DL96DRAFT_1417055, partial [Flagelloscypha sp. PMI_526]